MVYSPSIKIRSQEAPSATLLLGAPNTTYFAVTGPRDNAGGAQTGIYGQDQWQVNDRLTLSFGLRWELLPPFVDKNGIQANFDPNYKGAGANGQGAILVNNILLNGLKPAPDVPGFVQRLRIGRYQSELQRGHLHSRGDKWSGRLANGPSSDVSPQLRSTRQRCVSPFQRQQDGRPRRLRHLYCDRSRAASEQQ